MEPSKNDDLKARGAGLVLAAIGAYFLKSSFFDVMRSADAGSSRVTTSGKAVLVAPMFVLVGVVLVLVGAPGDGSSGVGRHFVDHRTRRLRPAGWLLAILGVVPGLVLYLWLRDYLAARGYH